MSAWLFLCLSLIGLSLTGLVVAPSDRGRRRSVAGFTLGLPAGELALHRIALEAIATLGFWLADAFATWPGQLGLALTAISWTGALYAYTQSFHAHDRIEAALVEALGTNYREQIAPQLRAKLSESLDWSRIARPFSHRRVGVERVANIAFARASSTDIDLDVYRRTDGSQNCPVLLQIHGGAWTDERLDKTTQALPLMNQLAANGWICVSANYRLSPEATFPDHIVDVKRAIQWIRENGEHYGMDPGFIVITGGSAGGHLSALAALTANDPTFQPGFEDVDTSVYGCVPFYGIHDFIDAQRQNPNDMIEEILEQQVMKARVDEKPKGYESASPIHRVSANAPPFFAIHGECDSLVPVRHTRDLVSRLRTTSREPAAQAILPGAQHGFETFGSPRCQHTVNGVERYLNWIYSRYLADRA